MTTAVALPLALAAACGSSDDTATDPGSGSPSAGSTSPGSMSPSPTEPSPSSSAARPAPAGWPACGQVWKDGAKLPAHYKGCADNGAAVDAHELACESGQAFVLYAEHFWAVRGGVIHHASRKLANSPAYTADVATCRG